MNNQDALEKLNHEIIIVEMPAAWRGTGGEEEAGILGMGILG